MVVEMTDSGSKIIDLPLPQDAPKQCQHNIGLARSELGWEPFIELKEGLEKTIAYFEKLDKMPTHV